MQRGVVGLPVLWIFTRAMTLVCPCSAANAYPKGPADLGLDARDFLKIGARHRRDRQSQSETEDKKQETPGRLTRTHKYFVHIHTQPRARSPQPTPHHTARYPPCDFVYYLLRRGTPRTCRVDGNSYAPLR